MKKIKLFLIILLTPCLAVAQNIVNSVHGYKPAPGQHINIESLGTPQAAEDMLTEVGKTVSLGSFGGYLVLGFENACTNDTGNPYGVDFTIFGNSFEGSSEPGVVWVMKDENQNGEADDTWYEIKGSQHFQSGTKQNYRVTYFKPETGGVLWEDNLGASGLLKANSYNTQGYYPTTAYFPGYPQDSVVFEGTLLEPAVDSSDPSQIVIKALDFGYADVHARIQGVDLTVPDNPYTTEVEGAGGDPIDISWAVGANGGYVDLDTIHFIKIATGNLSNVGWLGEISTDVAYVVDVDKNTEITGENELLVIYQHGPRLIVGDTLQLETNYFVGGKVKTASFTFRSQDAGVASVDPSGAIFAGSTGVTEIYVSSNGKTKSTEIEVVAPDSIEVLSDFSSVYVGDTILLEANIYDNNGDKMYTEIQFGLETPAAGNIVEIGDGSYFVAAEEGNATLSFKAGEFKKTISFKILSESDLIYVYFAAKNETENIVPLQKIEVGLSDFNCFVDNRANDYSALGHHTIAHAIVAGLQKTDVGFVFRDDENPGEGLYLYSVEKEGEFTYGWGGKTSPEAFAKAWVTHVNNGQYLNDFGGLELADGDTVILYHTSNIINSWYFTQMIPDKDSANVNDNVEIYLEQSTCTFSGGSITESTLSPILSQEIIADGISYYSDEKGETSVLISKMPPLTIFSGNDAVLISKKVITSSHELTDQGIQVYPNPVEKELMVSGSGLSGKQMCIFNLNGESVWSELAPTSVQSIDVQDFPPGVYVLKILGGTDVKTFKFIKE